MHDWDAQRQDLLSTPRWGRLAEEIGLEKCEELLDRAIPPVVQEAERRGGPIDEKRYAEELQGAYEQAGLGTLEPEQAETLAAEALTAFRLAVWERTV